MENQLRIVALVGSLRRASYTRRVVNSLSVLAPHSMSIEITPIDGLALYNEDLDTETPPPAWQAFRGQVRHSDAVLFATPEFDRWTRLHFNPPEQRAEPEDRRGRSDHRRRRWRGCEQSR